MRTTAVENIGEYVGRQVLIRGWVYNKRSSGKVKFLLVRDGTGIIQCVILAQEVDDERDCV